MDRRTIPELVAKYTLEPTIRDVFVEGPSDRRIVWWVLQTCDYSDVKVLEIGTVDVPAALLAENDYTSGERQRVRALAAELERLLGRTMAQASCVIDADCDRLLGVPIGGDLLLATDYPSMEVYLFHQDDLGKFVGLVLGDATEIVPMMERYAAILGELFLARAANYQLGLGLRWLDFTKCCRIDAGITFDRDEFIKRLLEERGLRHRRADFLAAIEALRARAAPDVRHQIHGHDFIALLSWDHSGAARRCGLSNEKAVRAAMIGCLGVDRLRKEALFTALCRRLRRRGNTAAPDGEPPAAGA